MGNESLTTFGRFDLRDLGVLGETPDRDFDTAVAVAVRAIRAPISTFAVLDFDNAVSRLRAHSGLSSVAQRTDAIPLESALILKAMSETDIIAIPDVARDPAARDHPFLRAHGIQSLLAAPVLCPAREVIGLLAVHDLVPRIWTTEERESIAGLARLCTQVILLRASLRTLGMVSRKAKSAP
jgi:GAF domain-containing protein